MKFGIQVSSDDPPELDRTEVLANYVERAVAARDAGFDMVSVGHRYSYGPAKSDSRGEPLVASRFQPLLVLAHLAGHLGDSVDYFTAVLVSTPLNPVQLAEDAASLDAMTGGRLLLGVGLGWMPYEFEAFDVDRKTRVRRFEELITATRQLLTQDEVDFEGEFFTFRNARLIARSVQRPHPPILIGASVDAAIERAARMGLGWTMSAHIELGALERQVGVFERACREHGHEIPAERPVNRQLFLAEDRETALREAETLLADWYRKRGEWGWFLTNQNSPDAAKELIASGRWVIGSPDDCVEQIARIRNGLGVSRVNFVTSGTWSTQETRLRTIELFSDRVLPYVRE